MMIAASTNGLELGDSILINPLKHIVFPPMMPLDIERTSKVAHICLTYLTLVPICRNLGISILDHTQQNTSVVSALSLAIPRRMVTVSPTLVVVSHSCHVWQICRCFTVGLENYYEVNAKL